MRVTYNQLLKMVLEKGIKETAKQVDSVALGVFEPLENVVLSLNISGLHIKPFSAKLQNVPLYNVSSDTFILGSQTLAIDDGMNSHFPGEFAYGGAFLIEDLINRAQLDLRINGYPNDVHDKQEVRKFITNEDVDRAQLTIDVVYPQALNAYVNSTENYKFSENGVVKTNFQTVNFRSNGVLQLIYEIKEFVSEVFVAGAKGSILFGDNGYKIVGDFKEMDTLYISGLSLKGYGIYLAAGIGIVVKAENNQALIEKILSNEARAYNLFDIGIKKDVGTIPLAQLKKPTVSVNNLEVKTCSLTSIYLAQKISEKLIVS